jgi:cytochrome c553
MNKWIRRSLITIAAIGVLGAATLSLGAWLGERKSARHVEVAVKAIDIPHDASSVARGRYLFSTRGCVECHGADGGGKAFIDDAGGGGLYAKAPNISTGPGNVVAAYRPEDWVRTIRHGVKPGGEPLFIMPSEDYNRLSDADLGALVAYIVQLPPVNGSGMLVRVPAFVKTLYAAGLIQDAAEKIDHTLPPAATIAEDGSTAHGAYVATMCIGCHGEHLSGGRIPGGPPDWPAAANLTPGEGSAMARYASVEQFSAMLRSGKRPDGSAVSTVMPFTSLRALSDADTRALFAHLKKLPPVPAGQR